MALSKQFVVILGLALATQAVFAYDPSITTDYGLIGATSGENFTNRAFEPSKLPPATSSLQLVPAFAAQYPGVTGLGISSVYFISPPGGEVPPHTHPRATEIFFVLTGNWYVGFIDTAGTLFNADLVPGDQFVFPIGLLHFQFVTSQYGTATGYSTLNSENPGVQLAATSLFASIPSVADKVLAIAFNITIQTVDAIKSGLA